LSRDSADHCGNQIDFHEVKAEQVLVWR